METKFNIYEYKRVFNVNDKKNIVAGCTVNSDREIISKLVNSFSTLEEAERYIEECCVARVEYHTNVLPVYIAYEYLICETIINKNGIEKYIDYINGKDIPDSWDSTSLTGNSDTITTNKIEYHEYPSKYIGYSDIASLILVGMENDKLTAEILHFGSDGSYNAHIVDENASFGNHYDLQYVFHSWMRIYDDEGCTAYFEGDTIKIYTAGDFGCLIQICK